MTIDLTPKELADRLTNQPALRIIDVRDPEEYRACHLPGAVNVPLETIVDAIPGVPHDEPVVVVCKGGMRSSMACARLAKAYRTMYNLKGGTDHWRELGYPGVSSPKALGSPEGQSYLIGGLLAITGAILAVTVHRNWALLSALPGFGLTLYATTGFCPMKFFLEHMPWNQPQTCRLNPS